jgi:glycosyltransferase involved in cell wall biosynthesis
LLKSRRPDYLFVESPPLSLAVPAMLAAKYHGCKVIFNVSDLWPDSVRSLGFVGDGIALRFAERLEAWAYRNSDLVCGVTVGICESLLRKDVPASKLLFLPNGINTDVYEPLAPEPELAAHLGMAGKQVFVYAGTHGYSHDLERILEAALVLRDRSPSIHFLFVGHGSAKAPLQAMALDLGLHNNITFLDPVPSRQVTRLMALATAGIVSLKDSPIADMARPAKTFAVMSCSKPVLYVGSGEGERLVNRARAGIAVSSRDTESIATAIESLADNPDFAAELGANGRRWVVQNLAWPTILRNWLQQLTTREVDVTALLAAARNPRPYLARDAA